MDPKLIIVSDKLGRDELKESRPIAGPAGKILDECLRDVSLSRNSVYCTTIAKQFGEIPDEFCLTRLAEELDQINCKSIVILGEECLRIFCARPQINKWRGSVLEIPELPNKFIIPTYHPETIIPLKYGGEGQYLNKLLIKWDLSKALRINESGFHCSQRELIIAPTFLQVMQYLKKCEDQGLAGQTIDFDIELMNMEVSCIAIGWDYHSIMSIPFINECGLYFTPDQDIEIWLQIASILENPKIKKRGQYLIFDTHFLLRKFGIKTHNIDDTMVAQKILMPDYPVGLDFITSIYTDKEYYKDEGKKYFSGGNWPRLWQYNATDASICGEAFPQQIENLKNQDNIATYNRQVKMIEPLCYAMERGIKIDVEAMHKEFLAAEIKIEELKKELHEICGYELNPNSPKQLINHFYVNKRIPPYKKGGKVTTDEKALVRIARRGHVEAAKILEIRRATKRKSTYLDITKVDSDGRMRCAYNPVGTRYSRISSGESIFGSGTNMQNQPHDILKFFMADDGYIYYGFDLSQAENRIVAYVGQIPQMIEAFENNLDVHSLTGSLISGLSVEEVRRQDDENICCPIGGGDKTWRYFGKRSNHGLNYDLGYKTFALYLEIPETDAKFIVDRYHMSYPGVRNNYHAYIRKQLSDNRTITNLMDRKTVFLQEWGDDLFKEAYACIPQGTVGDVINERGVEYIYYNQHLFGGVEFLIQVHDSVGIQIPISYGLAYHARVLTLIKQSLQQPLILPNGNNLIIPVDIVAGLDLYKGHCKKVKATDEESTLQELAKIYDLLVKEQHDRATNS
jgi:uracil-DNA glycosylase family 4